MATVLVPVPIYQIGSNFVVNRSAYPYGMSVYFAGASINVQPVSSDTLNGYQAGRQAGGALIYAGVRSAATGDNVFYTNLTPAAIAALTNA